MTKENNFMLFDDLIPEVQDRIMEYVYNKINLPAKETNKIDKLLENLKFLVPDECKDIIMELDDLIVSIKAESIRNTTFFILKNAEAIKKGIIGI